MGWSLTTCLLQVCCCVCWWNIFFKLTKLLNLWDYATFYGPRRLSKTSKRLMWSILKHHNVIRLYWAYFGGLLFQIVWSVMQSWWLYRPIWQSNVFETFKIKVALSKLFTASEKAVWRSRRDWAVLAGSSQHDGSHQGTAEEVQLFVEILLHALEDLLTYQQLMHLASCANK